MVKCKECRHNAEYRRETGIMPDQVEYYCYMHRVDGCRRIYQPLQDAVDKGELVGVVNGQAIKSKKERELDEAVKKLRERYTELRAQAFRKRKEAGELIAKANQLQIEAGSDYKDAAAIDRAIKIIGPNSVKTHDIRSDSGTGSYRIREYSDKTGTCECADYYNRQHACKHLRRLGLSYRAI